MNQKSKKSIDNIFIYQNKYFKINNSTLLHRKAVYKHHSNDIKIDDSIVIALNNLKQPHILSLFFE